MATLESRKLDNNEVDFFLDVDTAFTVFRLSLDEAWEFYRNFQRELVGPYSGRNGKYNGN